MSLDPDIARCIIGVVREEAIKLNEAIKEAGEYGILVRLDLIHQGGSTLVDLRELAPKDPPPSA